MLKKSLEAARGAYLDAKVVCKQPIESALPPTSGTCVWAMGCGGAAGGLIGSLAGWLGRRDGSFFYWLHNGGDLLVSSIVFGSLVAYAHT